MELSKERIIETFLYGNVKSVSCLFFSFALDVQPVIYSASELCLGVAKSITSSDEILPLFSHLFKSPSGKYATLYSSLFSVATLLSRVFRACSGTFCCWKISAFYLDEKPFSDHFMPFFLGSNTYWGSFNVCAHRLKFSTSVCFLTGSSMGFSYVLDAFLGSTG